MHRVDDRLRGNSIEQLLSKMLSNRQKKIELIKALLLENGDKLSTLHQAVRQNQLEAVKTYLLSRKGFELKGTKDQASLYEANIIGLELEDARGQTALFYAILHQNEEITELLLEHGAKIHHTNKLGITPLHLAAIQSNPKILSLVLKQDANINIIDREGETPLDYAVYIENVTTIRLLLEGAKSLTERCYNGALQKAVEGTQIEVLKELLLHQNGMKINAKNIYTGMSALHCAAAIGNFEAVKLLVEYGADVKAKKRKNKIYPIANKNTLTAKKLARQTNHTEIYDYLKSIEKKPSPQQRESSTNEKTNERETISVFKKNSICIEIIFSS